MSKLIVEMEMPKNCYLCPMSNFFVDKQTYCRLTMRWEGCTQNGFKRPSWCPIVGELPEQHGDLIDRDELKKQCWHDDGFEMWVSHAEIDQQPTVVAAERKDDETTAD